MRVAVVGHTEWIEFLRVPHVPVAGEIVHGTAAWAEPGGGGAVSAVQCLKLAGAATFFTAVGNDALGVETERLLTATGLDVRASHPPTPHRRGITFVDDAGERTITVVGERLGPCGDNPLGWDDLAGEDAVYFTAGDQGALMHARRAKTLVVTARALEVLAGSGVQADALVGSARDAGEAFEPDDLDPPPRISVKTMGGRGGIYRVGSGSWIEYEPAAVPGPVADAYGCGDSFAAGLTVALGDGASAAEAVVLAALCGAACLTGQGPYAGQIDRR